MGLRGELSDQCIQPTRPTNMATINEFWNGNFANLHHFDHVAIVANFGTTTHATVYIGCPIAWLISNREDETTSAKGVQKQRSLPYHQMMVSYVVQYRHLVTVCSCAK